MSANELYHYQSRQVRQLHACKCAIAILIAAMLITVFVMFNLANLSIEQDKLIKIQDDTITAMQERVDILNQTIDILELTNAITPEV